MGDKIFNPEEYVSHLYRALEDIIKAPDNEILEELHAFAFCIYNETPLPIRKKMFPKAFSPHHQLDLVFFLVASVANTRKEAAELFRKMTVDVDERVYKNALNFLEELKDDIKKGTSPIVGTMYLKRDAINLFEQIHRYWITEVGIHPEGEDSDGR